MLLFRCITVVLIIVLFKAALTLVRQVTWGKFKLKGAYGITHFSWCAAIIYLTSTSCDLNYYSYTAGKDTNELLIGNR